MTGVRSETGQGGFAIRKSEIAGFGTGFQRVVAVAADFSTKFQAMLTAQIREGVLVDVTFWRIVVFAADAQRSWKTGEARVPKPDGRKAVVRNAGNAQLRSELGVFGDVVFVLETVVSDGEFVDHARVDGPEVREANLGAADELALDRIDGLSGERREASAVAVEAVTFVPCERAGELLIGGQHMINLPCVGIARQDRTATAENGRVPRGFIVGRIGKKGQIGGAGCAELRSGNDVQLAAGGERVTDGGVCIRDYPRLRVRLPRKHFAGGRRIVDLVFVDRPTESICTDLSQGHTPVREQSAKISVLHGRRGQGHRAVEEKAAQAIAFEIEKEKRVISLNGATERAAKVVFLQVRLGGNTCGC